MINPNSRRQPNAARLAQGVAWLTARDWIIEQRRPASSAETIELATRAAVEQYGAVVACGGDGTLHDALRGLVGAETALGHIPCGTVNVWAREAHLPRDPLAALRLLEEGHRVRIDTGSAGSRPFLLMASIGLDSLVAGRVRSGLKRYLSFLPYLAYAAWELPRYRGVTATITLDGERIVAPVIGILAGNTRSYGGLLRVAARARVDDGLLDVCLLHGTGSARFVQHLGRIALSRHLHGAAITYRQARSVSIAIQPPWPVQLDGEVATQTPVTFECVPRSLTVIVPPGLRTPLWDASALV